jgi:adenylate kinase family enzyme
MLDRKRSDDTIESINNRIQQYHNITEPSFNVFNNQNKLYEIDSSGTIENTFKSIQNIISIYNKK